MEKRDKVWTRVRLILPMRASNTKQLIIPKRQSPWLAETQLRKERGCVY
jgi:hypothetical protein